MKGLFKQSAQFFGYHLLYSVVSLIFLMPFARFIYYNDGVTKPIGGIIYTVALLIIYLPCIYLSMWKLGKSHSKSDSEIKPNPAIALKISILSEVPTLILLIVMIVFHFKNPGEFNLFVTIFKLWQAIYIGVLDLAKPIYPITIIVPVLFAFLGYIAGTKNFVFVDKYIYPLIFKKQS